MMWSYTDVAFCTCRPDAAPVAVGTSFRFCAAASVGIGWFLYSIMAFQLLFGIRKVLIFKPNGIGIESQAGKDPQISLDAGGSLIKVQLHKGSSMQVRKGSIAALNTFVAVAPRVGTVSGAVDRLGAGGPVVFQEVHLISLQFTLQCIQTATTHHISIRFLMRKMMKQLSFWCPRKTHRAWCFNWTVFLILSSNQIICLPLAVKFLFNRSLLLWAR